MLVEKKLICDKNENKVYNIYMKPVIKEVDFRFNFYHYNRYCISTSSTLMTVGLVEKMA